LITIRAASAFLGSDPWYVFMRNTIDQVHGGEK